VWESTGPGRLPRAPLPTGATRHVSAKWFGDSPKSWESFDFGGPRRFREGPGRHARAQAANRGRRACRGRSRPFLAPPRLLGRVCSNENALPGVRPARRREGPLDDDIHVEGRPNAHLARELMELFSLGGGNSTELDVREDARASTGGLHRGPRGALELAQRPDRGDLGARSARRGERVPGDRPRVGAFAAAGGLARRRASRSGSGPGPWAQGATVNSTASDRLVVWFEVLKGSRYQS